MRGRRGFTLVEVLVASAVACGLGCVLLGLQLGGVRQYDASQERLEAQMVAQSVLDRIQSDLRGAVVPDRARRCLVVGGPGGSSARFFVGAPDPRPGGIYRALPVEYRLAPGRRPGTSCFSRNGRAHPALPLERLTFEVAQATALDGGPLFFLRVTVGARGGTGAHVLTLRALLALDALTRARRGAAWNPTPYVWLRAPGAAPS